MQIATKGMPNGFTVSIYLSDQLSPAGIDIFVGGGDPDDVPPAVPPVLSLTGADPRCRLFSFI